MASVKEILQVMFWLQEEGFATAVDAAELERLLGGADKIGTWLRALTEQGLTEPVGSSYRLTQKGSAEAASLFAAQR